MSRLVLFLPVSGPIGSGEFMRCKILAEAARKRWPEDRHCFVVSRAAPYVDELHCETVLVDRSPTFHTEEVNEVIRRMRPDVVIFDNAGRKDQMKCARKVGARTVFISSRPRRRRKAFRPDRMRLITQHWLAQPEASLGSLSAWEALKVRVMGQRAPLFLGSIFHPSKADRRMSLRRRIGVDSGPYVLLCHGGGDLSEEDGEAPRIFARVAEKIARVSDCRAVVVGGRTENPEAVNGQRVVFLANLSNEFFIDLMHDASLIVSGGGAGLIGQVLAHRKICVSIPFADDQRVRLRRCRELGLVKEAPLDFETISDLAAGLLDDEEERRLIGKRMQRWNIGNGLESAMEALAILRG